MKYCTKCYKLDIRYKDKESRDFKEGMLAMIKGVGYPWTCGGCIFD